jgi:hypothetical protein
MNLAAARGGEKFRPAPEAPGSVPTGRYRSGGLTGEAGVQALSRLRPRARRAAITLRPPLVAMRARKPCRRFRTSLLGWYVRFTLLSPIA